MRPVHPALNNYYLLPYPTQDVDRRYMHIFWGLSDVEDPLQTASLDKVNSIREHIIQTHFRSSDPTVLTLGKFSVRPTKLVSEWDVIYITANDHCKKNSFIEFIGRMTQLTMIISIISFVAIKFYFSRDFKLPNFIFMSAFLLFNAIVIFANIYCEYQDLKGEYLKLREIYSKKFAIFQELNVFPSSNHAATEDGINPITQDIIPLEVARSPRTLKIGTYTVDIREALRSCFARHQKFQKIRHPLENRTLTKIEAEQFLDDVRRFFCIATRRELFAAWQEKLSVADLAPFHQWEVWQSSSESDRQKLLKQYEQAILPHRVAKKFLSLVPFSTRYAYFPELSNEREPQFSFPTGHLDISAALEAIRRLSLSTVILIAEISERKTQ